MLGNIAIMLQWLGRWGQMTWLTGQVFGSFSTSEWRWQRRRLMSIWVISKHVRTLLLLHDNNDIIWNERQTAWGIEYSRYRHHCKMRWKEYSRYREYSTAHSKVERVQKVQLTLYSKVRRVHQVQRVGTVLHRKVGRVQQVQITLYSKVRRVQQVQPTVHRKVERVQQVQITLYSKVGRVQQVQTAQYSKVETVQHTHTSQFTSSSSSLTSVYSWRIDRSYSDTALSPRKLK